jgi:hypothetical protein
MWYLAQANIRTDNPIVDYYDFWTASAFQPSVAVSRPPNPPFPFSVFTSRQAPASLIGCQPPCSNRPKCCPPAVNTLQLPSLCPTASNGYSWASNLADRLNRAEADYSVPESTRKSELACALLFPSSQSNDSRRMADRCVWPSMSRYGSFRYSPAKVRSPLR